MALFLCLKSFTRLHYDIVLQVAVPFVEPCSESVLAETLPQRANIAPPLCLPITHALNTVKGTSIGAVSHQAGALLRRVPAPHPDHRHVRNHLGAGRHVRVAQRAALHDQLPPRAFDRVRGHLDVALTHHTVERRAGTDLPDVHA